MRISKAALVICVLAACCGLMAAEPTATIIGTVRDTTGAVVPNAKILVENIETGLRRRTTTSTAGSYVLPLLPVGKYALSVEASGFKKYLRQGIVLSVAETARVDVRVEVGSMTQTVQVNANSNIVDTTTSAIRYLVDPQRMQDLPLNGRDILQFQFLLPGITPSLTDTQALTGPFTPASASMNGARGASNNYILDGGEATDPEGGGLPAPFPNPDALEEFSVLTSSYSAQYGRYAGGVVTAVTKSGTNQFHGDLFEFLRNDALNARSFFSFTNPAYKQNQFGVTLGGPVILPKIFNGRNKLFFFTSYQDTIIHQAPTQSSAVVPTEAEREGDFSSAKQKPIDPATNAPFPGNKIPVSDFDPAAVSILDKWVPLPNTLSGQYIFNRPQINDTDQFVEKVDAQLGAKDHMFGRYLYQFENYDQFSGNLPGFYGTKGLRYRNMLLDETHVFQPNLLNDFHAAYLRYLNLQLPASGQSYADVGIHVFIPSPPYPSLSVSGWFNASVRRPSDEVSNAFEYADTITYTHSRHILKAGASAYREQYNSFVGNSMNPAIGFDGSVTGNAFADFLLGRPNTLTQSSADYFAARRTTWSLFLQDNWKVSSRLTLNLGLRWDPLTPVTDLQNRLTAYRPGEQSQKFPLAPEGLVFPGDPGIPRATFGNDLNNLAPRFGLAWDPTGSGRWSVRSGYGIFYDLERVISIGQFTSQQPWSLTDELFDPPSLSNPYDGSVNPFPFIPPLTPEAQRSYPFQLPIIADVINPNFQSAYVQQWSFSIEHSLSKDLLLTAAYAGSKGTHLHYDVEINPAVYEGPGSTVANTNQRRPLYPTFGSLSENDSGANSIYNSFQFSLNKRFSHGLSILASYTFSKAIDTISTGREGQFKRITNPYNLNAYRGLADFDFPQRFVASWIWDLPAFQSRQGLAGKLFGGWSLDGIATVQSGEPYSIVSGTDRSLSAVGGDMADLIGNPYLPSGRPDGRLVEEAFNTAAFAPAKLGTFGTAGRNIMRGWPTRDLSFSLVKRVRLQEGRSLQFRAEFFDALNRPTFSLPQNKANSGSFGKIQTAGDSRVGQLAVKFVF